MTFTSRYRQLTEPLTHQNSHTFSTRYKLLTSLLTTIMSSVQLPHRLDKYTIRPLWKDICIREGIPSLTKPLTQMGISMGVEDNNRLKTAVMYYLNSVQ